MEALKWMQENWEGLFAVVGALVTAASLIVKLTPSTKDDEVLGKVLKFIELFSVFNKKTTPPAPPA